MRLHRTTVRSSSLRSAQSSFSPRNNFLQLSPQTRPPDKTNPRFLRNIPDPKPTVHSSTPSPISHPGPDRTKSFSFSTASPGNEKNLDLAQAIRRDGWGRRLLRLPRPRGARPGDFSFTHSIEDVQSAIAYIRTPANAKTLRAGPLLHRSHRPQHGRLLSPLRRRAGSCHPGRRASSPQQIWAVDHVQSLKPDQQNASHSRTRRRIRPITEWHPLAGCTPESPRQGGRRKRCRMEYPCLGTQARYSPPCSSSHPTTVSLPPTRPS